MTSNKKVQFVSASEGEMKTVPELKKKHAVKEGGLFEVFAGSYEKILYGLKFCVNLSYKPLSETEGDVLETEIKGKKGVSFPYQLTPEFIFPAHIGSIRTIAAGPGRFLSTGSTDEIIKLYDLKRRKELGFLSEHNGTITCLKFFGKTHMFSGSEDKNIMIWRTKDWECLKVLKGHKGHLNDISLHPNGQLALSVGDDRVLLLWNLMTGQRASSIRLDFNAKAVAWSPSGKIYAIMFPHSVHFYSVGSSDPFCKISSPSVRAVLMSLEWVLADDKEYLAIGCGDGSVQLYGPFDAEYGSEEISSDTLNHLNLKGHGIRVKDISIVSRPNCTIPRIVDQTDVPQHFLITASSDGLVLVWDLSQIISRFLGVSTDLHSTTVDLTDFIKSGLSSESSLNKALVLASYNAKVRITCLATNFPFE